MSSKLGHMTNVYGFISTSLSPIITELCTMVDQHTLILSGRNDNVSPKVFKMTKVYGFISNSLNTITTKLDIEGDHHGLTLAFT